MKPLAICATLASLAAAPAAMAQSHHDHGAKAAEAPSAAMADGEVRKVDKDAGKVTLKHGYIRSLDMPPMTMVFQVQDRAVLDRLKAGDRVRFAAEEKAGAYVVTAIEPAK
ncbi:MAG: copper-binding protein [Burkholderiales bacterium]|jgi:Cu/Ag efflux protein CusF|nr:copper-binding protein [Burkholderiales bacterium]